MVFFTLIIMATTTILHLFAVGLILGFIFCAVTARIIMMELADYGSDGEDDISSSEINDLISELEKYANSDKM